MDAPVEATASPARPTAVTHAVAFVFAFVGSGCLLVLELVAARLIAPTVGVSLYTWTSVIGVVLGGVSLGNYLGGRLADRWPSRSTLSLVYLAASAASLLVLGVLHFVTSLELPHSAPALLQVLWITAILFLLPSTILGAPTPILTRLSLSAVDETGRVVGRIQAGAALGSIVGAFLTGFFLVSWAGTRHIVAGVAATLLLLAVLAGLPRWFGRLWAVGLLAALIVGTAWVSHSPCLKESSYYCIRLSPGTITYKLNGQELRTTPPIQTLLLDHLAHSVVDLLNPTDLQYNYEVEYAWILNDLRPQGSRLDTFFIGGGGFAFPRFVKAEYRGSLTVAEIDPEVTKVAEQRLGLVPTRRMKIVAEDAREELRSQPSTVRYDAIFGDAFDDYEVPYHLTTREFDRLVASHLAPHGLYFLNVVDAVHHDFLRSEIRTLREVFPYVALAPLPGTWPPSWQRATFVILARNRAPLQHLGETVPQGALDRFVERGHSVVLTDDHAPVEQLLAPVFSQALKKRR
jgi:MFS family permease